MTSTTDKMKSSVHGSISCKLPLYSHGLTLSLASVPVTGQSHPEWCENLLIDVYHVRLQMVMEDGLNR
jgi:hypothetical protein